GAMLGGWIGGAIFGADMNEFFSISTWLCAVGGSLIVLVVWGFISRKMSKSKTKAD
ncbi:MAG: GlsB/YeaQ/YmgE family stress response membrane protein, partial [Brevibacterium sp.]|nr:GlsB/YeaQ/YmgE family stress response membrane protein [Brevibacterium sp.]